MATVEEGLQAQIRNIEATYGKTMPDWFALIAASGRTKHTEIVVMLKSDYGMNHGAAHRVSLLARHAVAAPPDADGVADPADALYIGQKAALRPIHNAVMRAITTFGDDVEIAPKKDYLSLRRRKQFAMVQPRTAGWLDVGIILKDMPANGRLEWATGFNALFTHRVRITAIAEVDAELVGWLNHAYEQAE